MLKAHPISLMDFHHSMVLLVEKKNYEDFLKHIRTEGKLEQFVMKLNEPNSIVTKKRAIEIDSKISATLTNWSLNFQIFNSIEPMDVICSAVLSLYCDFHSKL